MGRGRMLAMGGLAAAGLWWFGRRSRHQESLGEEWERRPAKTAEHADDPVDEAIAESFPASDPPSYAGSRSTAED